MVNGTETVTNPYGFTGRVLDSESGLMYYRTRYYDTSIGRFISADPIGFIGGINLYAYCLNNPVSWIDPFGLLKFRWHGNWGGPGWSAGQYKPESQLMPEDFEVPARDARDECYKEHDKCIWNCHRKQDKNCPDNSALSDCIEGCDHKLGNCLWKIPPWDKSWWRTSEGWWIDAWFEGFEFHTDIPVFVH
jgi:RHS repeat-associated protein